MKWTTKPKAATQIVIENDRERLKKLEAYLDLGHGEAYLRHPEVARLIENALLFLHAERCELRAWVVMPNHVHALFKVSEISMENIVESWKSYTANEANKLLHRRSRFWQPGYWDTYMRDAQHELKAVRYIETNPVKVNLRREPKAWLWSSARYRDEFARLALPSRRAAFQAAAGATTTSA
jgi:putative DNA methylase